MPKSKKGLSLRFYWNNDGAILRMDTLNMEEKYRDQHELIHRVIGGHGCSIKSISFPDIIRHNLYLPGSDTTCDAALAEHCYVSQKQMVTDLIVFCRLIYELNKRTGIDCGEQWMTKFTVGPAALERVPDACNKGIFASFEICGTRTPGEKSYKESVVCITDVVLPPEVVEKNISFAPITFGSTKDKYKIALYTDLFISHGLFANEKTEWVNHNLTNTKMTAMIHGSESDAVKGVIMMIIKLCQINKKFFNCQSSQIILETIKKNKTTGGSTK